MKVLAGKGACPGIAIGSIYYIRRTGAQIVRRKVLNTSTEILRVEKARARAIRELDALHQKALGSMDEKEASLFSIHQMILQDPDYWGSVTAIIEGEGVNAEYAVKQTAEHFADIFRNMEDPYMQARAADMLDVSDRLIRLLQGGERPRIHTDVPVIVAAEDLSPSETVQLERNKILAFVTAQGSVHSHASILARTLGIPAIVGVGEELTEEYGGQFAIVDGMTGMFYIQPDKNTEKRMSLAHKRLAQQQSRLRQMRGKPDTTVDGREVLLYANIGGPEDMAKVLEYDARGIGLFRTEFLFLNATDFPCEEAQYEAYKKVTQQMGGRRVIIRTLDIGADKQAPYFHTEKERNPELGIRGVRFGLEYPAIFKTQLRAIYRASAHGKVAVMFPMVASLWEIQECKKMIEEVKCELAAEEIKFAPDVEIGIMIETPAAAIMSGSLAQEVDFFSIGTNDLTQYTLAADRENQRLSRYSNPHHPAVLRLVKMVVQNAHMAGKWVGVCGELAADMDVTDILLALGVDELSVSPSFVLPLRQRIRKMDLGKLQDKVARHLE